jgi:hypothetical protein
MARRVGAENSSSILASLSDKNATSRSLCMCIEAIAVANRTKVQSQVTCLLHVASSYHRRAVSISPMHALTLMRGPWFDAISKRSRSSFRSHSNFFSATSNVFVVLQ